MAEKRCDECVWSKHYDRLAMFKCVVEDALVCMFNMPTDPVMVNEDSFCKNFERKHDPD